MSGATVARRWPRAPRLTRPGSPSEARDRVRFEEEALALSDQVYRVARHLAARGRRRRTSCRRRTRARSAAGARTRPGTNLRAWLLRILTNLNIDRGRRSQRAPQTQPLEANDYYLYNKLADVRRRRRPTRSASSSGCRRTTSSSALAAVPHDFRDVIVLVDIGDFSYQDAAQILDIPIGTVMSRLHRGRRILKRELADSVMEDAS